MHFVVSYYIGTSQCTVQKTWGLSHLVSLRICLRAKRLVLLSDDVLLLNDNAQPHSTQQTFSCETLSNPPNRLDLGHSSCSHTLKKHLSGYCSTRGEDVQYATITWRPQQGNYVLCARDGQTLCCDNILNRHRDYTEQRICDAFIVYCQVPLPRGLRPCGPSLVEIACSNLVRGINISLLLMLFAVPLRWPIPRPEETYLVCVCHWVWSGATITLYT